MNLKKHVFSGVLIFCMMLFVSGVYGQSQTGEPPDRGAIDDIFPGDEALYKPTHTLDRGIVFNMIGGDGYGMTGNSRNYGYWQSNYSYYLRHGFWGQIQRLFPILAMPPGPWGELIPTYEFGTINRTDKYNVLTLMGAIYFSSTYSATALEPGEPAW